MDRSPRIRTGRRALAALVVLGLVAAACSSGGAQDGGRVEPEGDPSPPTSLVSFEGEPAGFEVSPGVEQLLVTGAAPGTDLVVAAADGAFAAEGAADENGALLVRHLAAGTTYRVVADGAEGREVSEATGVWAIDDIPDPGLYADQELTDGYQYLETRDGTLLAVNVSLPGPVEDGPYPTLVEYSGYSPADPDELQPLQLLANLLGYASVGVNMRGTGCSGGSFLFFEPAQLTDGYDVIETVASQSWSTDGVGMVGVSYPGISQLFVAKTQPPSLAAITPLAVIADTYRSTLYPGGILNDGFATSWAEDRQEQAAVRGQGWVGTRIDEHGDEVCDANQALRTQNADLFDFIAGSTHTPEDLSGYLGSLAPSEWVDRIDVPVFLAGAWQDEQTGGHFPTMLDSFTSAPVTRFMLTNGGHTESLSPDILGGLATFLDLYVGKRVPALPPGLELPLNVLGAQVFDVGLTMPADRFSGYESYEEARAAYEAEPSVWVLLEHGTGGEPGAPEPGVVATFDAWPIPGTEATTWYLGEGGELLSEASDREAVEAYTYDTSRAQQVTLVEGSPWVALPAWDWSGPEDGTALAYATEPLEATVVMAGSGRIDLPFGSTSPDVDIQVTLSELRPDGTEVYVQNGWLRASHRTLDPSRSGPLRPYHTHLEADAEPLPADGELVELAVELFPFAHVFREGSRIRLTIEGPGGTRPEWRFDALDAPDGTSNHVGVGGADGARVTLPVIRDVDVPGPAPACPSLRGQPCRPQVALSNRPR